MAELLVELLLRLVHGNGHLRDRHHVVRLKSGRARRGDAAGQRNADRAHGVDARAAQRRGMARRRKAGVLRADRLEVAILVLVDQFLDIRSVLGSSGLEGLGESLRNFLQISASSWSRGAPAPGCSCDQIHSTSPACLLNCFFCHSIHCRSSVDLFRGRWNASRGESTGF